MMKHRRITILVCLVEPLLQAGVRASLSGEPDMQVLAGDLTSQRHFDVLVTDYATAVSVAHDGRFPGGRHGELFPRILAVSAQVRERAVRGALELGIHGMVLTGSPVCDLLAGIRILSRGGKYLCPELSTQICRYSAQNMLTTRQDEVLQLLAKGQGDKAIARSLDIGVETVRTHVKAILSKLNASCRTEAARIAIEQGLVHFLSQRCGD
jgi:DNA-binding NarL/FixJ family response regulator